MSSFCLFIPSGSWALCASLTCHNFWRKLGGYPRVTLLKQVETVLFHQERPSPSLHTLHITLPELQDTNVSTSLGRPHPCCGESIGISRNASPKTNSCFIVRGGGPWHPVVGRLLPPNVSDFLLSQLDPSIENAEVVLLLESHLVHVDILLNTADFTPMKSLTWWLSIMLF